jgi:hypothetical protein
MSFTTGYNGRQANADADAQCVHDEITETSVPARNLQLDQLDSG